MPSDIHDLETDLIYLRKGPGLTPSRLTAAGTLILLLGGADQPYADLRERFCSAIDSLHENDAAVLRAAFALTPDTAGLVTLRQRRARYGQHINRGVDTVTHQENTALVNLRNQLLTGWYPASPLGSRVPELHNGIIQEHVAILTVVNDRRWQETREHYRFLALFDQADYLTISTSYPGIPIPLPEHHSPFTVRTRQVGTSYSHDFIHHTPMHRGQAYDLAYKLIPDPNQNDPGWITETSRAFHERTLVASFEVMFIGAKPQRIWSFHQLSYFERPGQPTGNQLNLGNGSSAQIGFRDLYGGLFNGIAWKW